MSSIVSPLGYTPFVPASDESQLGVGAKNGTGVSCEEVLGILHKSKLTFQDVAIALTDEAGVVAYGSLKIYDLPVGVINVLSCVVNLALTKSSAGVNADWDGDFGIGTAAAGNNATLTGTEQNIVPSTATPQAVSGATTATSYSGFAVPTSLTNSTGATANNTVADGLTVTALAALTAAAPAAATVGADIGAFTDPPSAAEMALLRTFVNALKVDYAAGLVQLTAAVADMVAVHAKLTTVITDIGTQNDNDSDLAAKINEILAQMSGGKGLTVDGHVTAGDIYINFLVDDADHNVAGTACNLILNGTIEIIWQQLGDF